MAADNPSAMEPAAASTTGHAGLPPDYVPRRLRRAGRGAASAQPIRLPVFALITLAAAGFVTMMAEMIPVGLLLLIQEDLKISAGQAGSFVGVYALGTAGASVPLAALTRSLPRKQLLLTLMAIFFATTIVTALSPPYYIIMVARLVAGMSAGVVWAILAGYAVGISPEDQQGRGMAIAMAGTPIALAFGIPIGTFIGDVSTWQTAFWAMGIATAVLFAIMIVILPQVPGEPRSAKRSVWNVVTLPGMRTVVAVTVLFSLGHNIAYTYLPEILKPAKLEASVGYVQLLFGATAAIGLFYVGRNVDAKLGALIRQTSGLLAVTAAIFAVVAAQPIAVLVAVALWGASFGGTPTLVQTASALNTGPSRDVGQALIVTAWNASVAGAAFLGGELLPRTGAVSLLVVGSGLALGAFLLSYLNRSAFRTAKERESVPVEVEDLAPAAPAPTPGAGLPPLDAYTTGATATVPAPHYGSTHTPAHNLGAFVAPEQGPAEQPAPDVLPPIPSPAAAPAHSSRRPATEPHVGVADAYDANPTEALPGVEGPTGSDIVAAMTYGVVPEPPAGNNPTAAHAGIDAADVAGMGMPSPLTQPMSHTPVTGEGDRRRRHEVPVAASDAEVMAEAAAWKPEVSARAETVNVGSAAHNVPGLSPGLLLELEETLTRKIVGQRRAVSTVSSALRKFRIHDDSSGSPLAALMLAGPAGVGADDLLTSLAETLFGDARSLVRVNLAGVAGQSLRSVLLGSAIGPGVLTKQLSARGDAVIVFDEPFSGPQDTAAVIGEMMCTGYLTHPGGGRIDVRRCAIIIANLDPRAAWFAAAGAEAAPTADHYRGLVGQHLGADVMRSLDDVAVLAPLDHQALYELTVRKASSIASSVVGRQVKVHVSKDAQRLVVAAALAMEPRSLAAFTDAAASRLREPVARAVASSGHDPRPVMIDVTPGSSALTVTRYSDHIRAV